MLLRGPGYAPTRTELRRLMTGVRVTVYVDDADLTSDQLLELMDAALRRRSSSPPPSGRCGAAARRCGWTACRGRPGLSCWPGSWAARCRRRNTRRPPTCGGPRAACRCRSCARRRWRVPPRARGGLRARAKSPACSRRCSTSWPRTRRRWGAAPAGDPRRGRGGGHARRGADRVAEPEAVCDRLVRLGLAWTGEHGYGSVADTVPVLRGRFPRRSRPSGCATTSPGGALRETTPPELAAHGRALEKVAEMAESAGRPDLAVRLARATSPGWPVRCGSACGAAARPGLGRVPHRR
ncbi:hypothetical protein NKH77_17305 [Streptomyces sp. M19]